MTSSFYPLRQWQTRTDVKALLPALTAVGEGLDPRKAESIGYPLLTSYLASKGVHFGPGGASVAILSQEIQGLLTWGEWAMSGKRIVDCTPELAQAFCRSDCGDMRISDLEVPYHCMYIRFPLSDADAIFYSDGRVRFEGAYIVESKDVATRIVLCGKAVSPLSAADQWRERYDLRILAEHFGKPAQDAITLALADDLADLRGHWQYAKDKGISTPESDASFRLLIDRMVADHPAYERALRLVLNALAYMQFGGDALAPGWPPEAPERMVRQAEEGSLKEQERSLSKLWALGHVPIFKLGGDFTRQFRHPAAGMRAHWRQGHWRRQAHGPQMSLRKLLWIFPTVVGAKDDDPPA
jgi:hypothetical protein